MVVFNKITLVSLREWKVYCTNLYELVMTQFGTFRDRAEPTLTVSCVRNMVIQPTLFGLSEFRLCACCIRTLYVSHLMITALPSMQ